MQGRYYSLQCVCANHWGGVTKPMQPWLGNHACLCVQEPSTVHKTEGSPMETSAVEDQERPCTCCAKHASLQ